MKIKTFFLQLSRIWVTKKSVQRLDHLVRVSAMKMDPTDNKMDIKMDMELKTKTDMTPKKAFPAMKCLKSGTGIDRIRWRS